MTRKLTNRQAEKIDKALHLVDEVMHEIEESGKNKRLVGMLYKVMCLLLDVQSR